MCRTISDPRGGSRLASVVAKAALGIGVAMIVVASGASAQQPTAPPPAAKPSRPQAIEIRGQVPTPQVVTVRPRQIPTFSHEVLTPAYFDQHFRVWLLAPYELAPNLSTAVRPASPPTTAAPATLPSDSAYRPSPAADSTRTSVPSQPARSADSSASASPPAPPTSPTAPREK